jgi:hypothetical protein
VAITITTTNLRGVCSGDGSGLRLATVRRLHALSRSFNSALPDGLLRS